MNGGRAEVGVEALQGGVTSGGERWGRGKEREKENEREAKERERATGRH